MKPAAPVTRMVPGEVSAIVGRVVEGNGSTLGRSVGFGLEIETQCQFEVRQSGAE